MTTAPLHPPKTAAPEGPTLEASPDSQTTPKCADTPALLTKIHRGISATELQMGARRSRTSHYGGRPTAADGRLGFFQPPRHSWGAVPECTPAYLPQAMPRVHPNLPGEKKTCRSGRNALGDQDGQFPAVHMEQALLPEQTDPSHRQLGGRLEMHDVIT